MFDIILTVNQKNTRQTPDVYVPGLFLFNYDNHLLRTVAASNSTTSFIIIEVFASLVFRSVIHIRFYGSGTEQNGGKECHHQ